MNVFIYVGYCVPKSLPLVSQATSQTQAGTIATLPSCRERRLQPAGCLGARAIVSRRPTSWPEKRALESRQRRGRPRRKYSTLQVTLKCCLSDALTHFQTFENLLDIIFNSVLAFVIYIK